MNASDWEIKAWISAGLTVLVFGYYIVEAQHAHTVSEMYHLFVTVVIALVVLQAALVLTARLIHRPGGADERDRAIETKAYRNAYFVMVLVMIPFIFHLLGQTLPFPALVSLPPTVLTAHWLILTLAVAELSRSVSQIFYYRRGA